MTNDFSDDDSSYNDNDREIEKLMKMLEKMSCKMWLKILAAPKNIRKENKIYSRDVSER